MANNVLGDPINTEFETLGNANNVFGDPITDETLEGDTEYAKKLRKLRVAMALDTDSLLFWDNPWNKASYSNQAYAEINQAGYYDNIDWGVIAGKGSNAGPQYRAAWKGCVSTVVIESGTTAKFEATLTFE